MPPCPYHQTEDTPARPGLPPRSTQPSELDRHHHHETGSTVHPVCGGCIGQTNSTHQRQMRITQGSIHFQTLRACTLSSSALQEVAHSIAQGGVICDSGYRERLRSNVEISSPTKRSKSSAKIATLATIKPIVLKRFFIYGALFGALSYCRSYSYLQLRCTLARCLLSSLSAGTPSWPSFRRVSNGDSGTDVVFVQRRPNRCFVHSVKNDLVGHHHKLATKLE